MRQIYDRLFVGDENHCKHDQDGWATVHACKSPCHQEAVGYRGSLPRNHPNYLVMELGDNLYLNMIDPPKPLFMLPLFTEFLSFAERHWNGGKKLLIHCNMGQSRAPSLGLLFMAKVAGNISNDSFQSAYSDYIAIDPRYGPGQGIQQYLAAHWSEM